MTLNPFVAPATPSDERGVFGNARRLRSSFLYRVIQLEAPYCCRIVYDGWWFRQKIEVNGEVVWFQISWLTIRRHLEFKVPASLASDQPDARIEIDFGRSLMIRRFRLWIDGQIAYDEINW